MAEPTTYRTPPRALWSRLAEGTDAERMTSVPTADAVAFWAAALESQPEDRLGYDNAAGRHRSMFGLTGVPCHCRWSTPTDDGLVWHYAATPNVDRVALEGGDLVTLCGHVIRHESGEFHHPDERDGVENRDYLPPGSFECQTCRLMRHAGVDLFGIRDDAGHVSDYWWAPLEDSIGEPMPTTRCGE